MTWSAFWRRGDARSWLGATLFGLLAYGCITSFSFYRDDQLQRATAYVFAASAGLFFLLSILGTPRWRVPRGRWWLLAAVVASTLASAALAPRWPMAWSRLQMYYGIALLGLAIYLFHRDDDGLRVEPYLISIAVVHALILVEVVFWMHMVQSGEASLARRMPYHGNVRHFGYLGYLAAACATALWMLTRRWKLLSFLLCMAALFGIIELGSRGALLAWMGFVATVVCLGRSRWRVMAMCTAAFVATLGVGWWLNEIQLLQLPGLVSRAQAGESFRAYDRLALWQDVLAAIVRSPWFGYGPEGQWASGCCTGRGVYLQGTAQPHNVVLQLLLEFGLVGTALIAWLLVSVCRNHTRSWLHHAKADDQLLVTEAALAGFLVFGLIDGLFFYPVPLLHLAALAALTFALAASRRAEACRPPANSEPAG